MPSKIIDLLGQGVCPVCVESHRFIERDYEGMGVLLMCMSCQHFTTASACEDRLEGIKRFQRGEAA